MRELDRLVTRIEGLQRSLAGSGDEATDGATNDSRLVVDSLRLETEAIRDQLEAIDADARLGALTRRFATIAATAPSIAERARMALEALCEAVSATRGVLVVLAADGDAKVLAEHPPVGDSGRSRAPSRALLGEVLEQRRSIRVSDATESRFSKETSVMSLGLRSILAAPLVVGERAWGVVYLESDSRDVSFAIADQGLLDAATSLIAALLRGPGAPAPDSPDKSTLVAGEIIGFSPAIQRLRATIVRLGDSDAPVLIEGESGTGKELVARAVHFSGRRAAHPFVAINCAAMPEGLVESELFGHERGAFTGATERKQGRFESAHRGTLFLDEIGEVRYEVQSKLLRVLQERSFTRVGGAQTVTVDVRLVAASNRNLRQLVAEGKFRDDLYYRLAVVPLEVPPLRDRPEDVPLLARHFLAEVAAKSGRRIELEPEVFRAFERYRFPGNVRELRNLIERLTTLADGDRVLASDLPAYVVGEPVVSVDKDPFRRFLRQPPQSNDELKEARQAMTELYESYVRRVEASFVRSMLKKANGSVSEAARLAGMNRTLFHRKLRDAEDEQEP